MISWHPAGDIPEKLQSFEPSQEARVRAGEALSDPVQEKIPKGLSTSLLPKVASRPEQETGVYGKIFKINTEINPGWEKFRNFKENPQTSPDSVLTNESEQG